MCEWILFSSVLVRLFVCRCTGLDDVNFRRQERSDQGDRKKVQGSLLGCLIFFMCRLYSFACHWRLPVPGRTLGMSKDMGFKRKVLVMVLVISFYWPAFGMRCRSALVW